MARRERRGREPSRSFSNYSSVLEDIDEADVPWPLDLEVSINSIERDHPIHARNNISNGGGGGDTSTGNHMHYDNNDSNMIDNSSNYNDNNNIYSWQNKNGCVAGSCITALYDGLVITLSLIETIFSTFVFIYYYLNGVNCNKQSWYNYWPLIAIQFGYFALLSNELATRLRLKSKEHKLLHPGDCHNCKIWILFLIPYPVMLFILTCYKNYSDTNDNGNDNDPFASIRASFTAIGNSISNINNSNNNNNNNNNNKPLLSKSVPFGKLNLIPNKNNGVNKNSFSTMQGSGGSGGYFYNKNCYNWIKNSRKRHFALLIEIFTQSIPNMLFMLTVIQNYHKHKTNNSNNNSNIDVNITLNDLNFDLFLYSVSLILTLLTIVIKFGMLIDFIIWPVFIWCWLAVLGDLLITVSNCFLFEVQLSFFKSITDTNVNDYVHSHNLDDNDNDNVFEWLFVGLQCLSIVIICIYVSFSSYAIPIIKHKKSKFGQMFYSGNMFQQISVLFVVLFEILMVFYFFSYLFFSVIIVFGRNIIRNYNKLQYSINKNKKQPKLKKIQYQNEYTFFIENIFYPFIFQTSKNIFDNETDNNDNNHNNNNNKNNEENNNNQHKITNKEIKKQIDKVNDRKLRIISIKFALIINMPLTCFDPRDNNKIEDKYQLQQRLESILKHERRYIINNLNSIDKSKQDKIKQLIYNPLQCINYRLEFRKFAPTHLKKSSDIRMNHHGGRIRKNMGFFDNDHIALFNYYNKPWSSYIRENSIKKFIKHLLLIYFGNINLYTDSNNLKKCMGFLFIFLVFIFYITRLINIIWPFVLLIIRIIDWIKDCNNNNNENISDDFRNDRLLNVVNLLLFVDCTFAVWFIIYTIFYALPYHHYIEDIEPDFEGLTKYKTHKSRTIDQITNKLKNQIQRNYQQLATSSMINYYVLKIFGIKIGCLVLDYVGIADL